MEHDDVALSVGERGRSLRHPRKQLVGRHLMGSRHAQACDVDLDAGTEHDAGTAAPSAGSTTG